MTRPEETPSQEQVDKARDLLARPRDDDEDAAEGTTRDVDTEPDAADPEP
jgi:hypothetical protein